MREKTLSSERVLIVTPTYNEAGNVASIVERARAAVPDAHILIVDDGSPDGTGQIVDQIAATDPAVHALHRTTKSGLGMAYVAGFRWGLARGYDVLVEMDADGSHQPEQLPAILAATSRADLVIGSRWVAGGSVRNWPWQRKVISRAANAYVKLALGLPVKDATAGFRAYRSGALEAINLSKVQAHGFAFQVDLTRRVTRRGLRIIEVPIEFVERTAGESKMSRGIMTEFLRLVTGWAFADRSVQLRTALARLRAK